MTEANAEQDQCARTALYRHFDKDGRLLYVGISLSAINRLCQHRANSHWFSEIVTVRVEWFDSRPEALAAERIAIHTERPAHNITHNRPKSVWAQSAEEYFDEAKNETVRPFTKLDPCYEIPSAARMAGIPEHYLKNALAAGDLPYYAANKVVITGWSLLTYMEALETGAVAVRKPEKLASGYARRAPTTTWLIENVQTPSFDAWIEFDDAYQANKLLEAESLPAAA